MNTGTMLILRTSYTSIQTSSIPVHDEMLGGVPNVWLIEPVDYETFVGLLSQAHLDKPVLVLCRVTERPEVTALGGARLVGSECESIVRQTVRLLEDPVAYRQMASVANPYGDGCASQRIVQGILAHSEEH